MNTTPRQSTAAPSLSHLYDGVSEVEFVFQQHPQPHLLYRQPQQSAPPTLPKLLLPHPMRYRHVRPSPSSHVRSEEEEQREDVHEAVVEGRPVPIRQVDEGGENGYPGRVGGVAEVMFRGLEGVEGWGWGRLNTMPCL